MRYLFLGLLIFIVGSTIFAQNLILDPGFEDWDGTIGDNPNTLGGLTHWYNANGTSDHHHQLNPPGINLTALEDCPLGNGQLQCGVPYEGQGVLGCWKGNGATGSKEWAGITMAAPMTAGGCYQISFWIQNKKDNPQFFMETNQWGVFFSHTQTPDFDANTLDFSTVEDQWVATDSVIGSNEWQQITLFYQANEPYRYAYLGYMGNIETSTYNGWSEDGSIGFYVWFDEVIIQPLQPTLSVSPNVSTCAGDSVLISAVSNFPLSWDNGVEENDIWVNPTETTTYYVEAASNINCGIMDSVVVTVAEAPLLDANITGVSCDSVTNGQISLTAEGTSGPYTFSWNTGQENAILANIGTGTYTLTVTDAAGCGFIEAFSVGIAETPLVSYPDPLCENDASVELSDISLDGSWSGPGVTDEILGIFDPTILVAGDYTVNYESATTCIENFAMEISIEPSPSVTLATDALEGCPPFTATLTVDDASPSNSYEWTIGENNFHSDLPETEDVLTEPGTYDVQVVATSPNGCQDSQSYPGFIQVFEPANAAFSFTPDFPSNVEPDIQFIDEAADNTILWNWSFGDGRFSNEVNPLHTFTGPGTYDVSLVATTTDGCTDTLTQSLLYREVVKLYVPNAFSPNDDGINDQFKAFAEGPIDSYSLQIFSRWGDEIFYTDDLNQAWDGKSSTGEFVPPGVYIYVIEYASNGETVLAPIAETLGGSVTLIR